MTELFFSVISPIGQEIENEAGRRVALIMKDVAAGKTSVEAEIKKRVGAT